MTSAPAAHDHLGWVLAAYQDLQTERPWTMAGPGPIPHSAVMAWSDRAGLALSETEFLRRAVREMENVELGQLAERAERERRSHG